MIVSVQAGDWLLQAAALRDTVVTQQVDAGMIQQISSVLELLIELALLALIIIAIPVIWKIRRSARRFEAVVERIGGDVAPVLKYASAIAEDVRHITQAIRGDVDTVNATVALANERVQDAMATAEHRLNEFKALLDVVQDEAEELFVSTVSTVRGVRSGASTFRRHDGMEFASVESDEADAALELETLDDDGEEIDGDDSFTEGDTAAPAPRVRPRSRGLHGHGRGRRA